jgi:transcriptional regulator with PAS, ATPase and Fis domain
MLDSQSIIDLPLVHTIRELVRNWWRLELGFTDARGYVLTHADGVAVPPPNDFCRLSLASPEGFKACNRSVTEAVERLLDNPTPGARLVQPCHLGFPQAMAPIMRDERVFGSVFTAGFVIEGHEETIRRSMDDGSRRLQLPIDNRWEAHAEVPVLSERDLEYLGSLMELAARELLTLVEDGRDPRHFGDLIGRSPKMQRLYTMLDRVSGSDATMLVIGENGTGKEVVARAIHTMSPRTNNPFVATNCAALNDNLLEAELFGYVKGAFTGAIRDKPGLFQVANTGTLFLDEVGDTSPAMQVKLLRVLQEGTFMPVGATEPLSVDVRVVAATNKPLRKMVEDGTFREDLYYRLNVIQLDVPPLRERKGDLPLLCDWFLDRMKEKTGSRKVLSAETLQYFWEYEWPGNVRQLENEIERLVVLSGEQHEIDITFLSPAIKSHGEGRVVPELDVNVRARGTLDQAIRRLERRIIKEGLVRTGWNKSQLARELGVSRTTLIKKIREHHLEQTGPATG